MVLNSLPSTYAIIPASMGESQRARINICLRYTEHQVLGIGTAARNVHQDHDEGLLKERVTFNPACFFSVANIAGVPPPEEIMKFGGYNDGGHFSTASYLEPPHPQYMFDLLRTEPAAVTTPAVTLTIESLFGMLMPVRPYAHPDPTKNAHVIIEASIAEVIVQG